jgi:hypothetical protein
LHGKCKKRKQDAARETEGKSSPNLPSPCLHRRGDVSAGSQVDSQVEPRRQGSAKALSHKRPWGFREQDEVW